MDDKHVLSQCRCLLPPVYVVSLAASYDAAMQQSFFLVGWIALLIVCVGQTFITFLSSSLRLVESSLYVVELTALVAVWLSGFDANDVYDGCSVTVMTATALFHFVLNWFLNLRRKDIYFLIEIALITTAFLQGICHGYDLSPNTGFDRTVNIWFALLTLFGLLLCYAVIGILQKPHFARSQSNESPTADSQSTAAVRVPVSDMLGRPQPLPDDMLTFTNAVLFGFDVPIPGTPSTFCTDGYGSPTSWSETE